MSVKKKPNQTQKLFSIQRVASLNCFSSNIKIDWQLSMSSSSLFFFLSNFFSVQHKKWSFNRMCCYSYYSFPLSLSPFFDWRSGKRRDPVTQTKTTEIITHTRRSQHNQHTHSHSHDGKKMTRVERAGATRHGEGHGPTDGLSAGWPLAPKSEKEKKKKKERILSEVEKREGGKQSQRGVVPIRKKEGGGRVGGLKGETRTVRRWGCLGFGVHHHTGTVYRRQGRGVKEEELRLRLFLKATILFFFHFPTVRHGCVCVCVCVCGVYYAPESRSKSVSYPPPLATTTRTRRSFYFYFFSMRRLDSHATCRCTAHFYHLCSLPNKKERKRKKLTATIHMYRSSLLQVYELNREEKKWGEGGGNANVRKYLLNSPPSFDSVLGGGWRLPLPSHVHEKKKERKIRMDAAQMYRTLSNLHIVTWLSSTCMRVTSIDLVSVFLTPGPGSLLSTPSSQNTGVPHLETKRKPSKNLDWFPFFFSFFFFFSLFLFSFHLSMFIWFEQKIK